ncbi:MAG TPA: tRNA pseudouridine(55) synthase TruB [Burkholderiales bacterium]|nr:tRNA pseudouridine(55) synthase TruB [Burkholderiales bacterium]
MGDAVSGVLLLDKPAGPSSNAVLQRAKRLLGAQRAGHTGTLDPRASGLLVVAFGEATKFSGGLLEADKAYRATVKLGERTSTGDAEGTVLSRSPVAVSESGLRAALERFRGEIQQTPPMHSAIKRDGVPLYAYARRGETVDRAPRRIAIRRLDLEGFGGDQASLYVECSKGTYIRTLAEDIGEALGCGAHLAALRRVTVGSFALAQSVGLDALEAMSPAARRAALLPPQSLLGSWPRLRLAADLAAKLRQGRSVPVEAADGEVAVFGEDEAFLGTGKVSGGALKPTRLLAGTACERP